MITKDLMIGDWVDVVNINHKVEELNDEIIDLGYEKTKRTTKISAVNLTGIHYDCEEYGPIFVPIEDLQPIPLTPEILEKNGFLDINGKKKVFRVKNLSSHVGLGISFYDSIPYIYLLDESTGVWPGYHQYDLFNCQYVHELQHALKLYRIEKEIVL